MKLESRSTATTAHSLLIILKVQHSLMRFDARSEVDTSKAALTCEINWATS